jgi:hypothetical protein
MCLLAQGLMAIQSGGQPRADDHPGGQIMAAHSGPLAEPVISDIRNRLAEWHVDDADRHHVRFRDWCDHQIQQQLGRRLLQKISGQLLGPIFRTRGEISLLLRTQILGQRWEELWERLGGQIWSQMGEQSTDNQFRTQNPDIRRQLHGRIPAIDHFSGAWEQDKIIAHDFCERIGVVYGRSGWKPYPPVPVQAPWALPLWLEEKRQCHWWFPYEGLVFASERPCFLSLDSDGRLHNSERAALEYRDGYSLYAWHGVTVPSWIIERPRDITVENIDQESNAEVRRVMLEQYGWTRYMADCDAVVVDATPPDHPIPGLRGARLLLRQLRDEPEPFVCLEMVNSTPESDGTHKRYLQRIDPNAYDGDAGRHCHAAMASLWHHRDDDGNLVRTFERWQDYAPTAES